MRLFGCLFPPADFVVEMTAAADWFCFFEGLKFERHPVKDSAFPAHDWDVAMGWRRIHECWIQPASILTATIAKANDVLDGELFVLRNPLDKLAINVEQRDVVAGLFLRRRCFGQWRDGEWVAVDGRRRRWI